MKHFILVLFSCLALTLTVGCGKDKKKNDTSSSRGGPFGYKGCTANQVYSYVTDEGTYRCLNRSTYCDQYCNGQYCGAKGNQCYQAAVQPNSYGYDSSGNCGCPSGQSYYQGNCYQKCGSQGVYVNGQCWPNAVDYSCGQQYYGNQFGNQYGNQYIDYSMQNPWMMPSYGGGWGWSWGF